MTSGLNSAYGGTLIQRLGSRSAAVKSAAPTLEIQSFMESDVVGLATGIFSPLQGFMNSREFDSVCRRQRLAGSDLAWTIPIVLDIRAADKDRIAGATHVNLKSVETGEVIGWIEPEEIYPHDKDLRIRSTFGVNDDSHPGVKMVRSMGEFLLAGKVTVFSEVIEKSEPLSFPSQVRERLSEMKLGTVAGFQTRNVVHRAHEYLQRLALEYCGGLLVQPIVGWKKAGDFKPEVVRHSYQKFIEAYYPANHVLLAFLRIAMRYAGPKEAVLHAIIRKNYGCSHFIVGRDHAGVGGFYGVYAAHEIFSTLPDLGIQILKFREPFFCSRCGSVATDKTCGHTESFRQRISGTLVRQVLSGGKNPQNEIFRPEVLESLRPFQKEGLFYE